MIAITSARSAMSTNEVAQDPSLSSPTNAGQLPFGFCILSRKLRARSRTGPESRDRYDKALHSSEACDDSEREAHPPLGNCLRAKQSRIFSACVTTKVLYCDLLISSNCQERISRIVIAERGRTREGGPATASCRYRQPKLETVNPRPPCCAETKKVCT